MSSQPVTSKYFAVLQNTCINTQHKCIKVLISEYGEDSFFGYVNIPIKGNKIADWQNISIMAQIKKCSSTLKNSFSLFHTS